MCGIHMSPETEIFTIPSAFQIVIDDVGWWCGKDDSNNNGPSRSGLNVRRHCVDDYRPIVEIGKSLNMRILCGFIIGEWDRSNMLARVRNSNQYGTHWDNASRLDPAIDEARGFINSSADHIEIALHGLMHMYWDDSGRMISGEFYQKNSDIMPAAATTVAAASDKNQDSHMNNIKYKMTPPDIVREHLDAFYGIYAHNGFKGNVTGFIPPCFQYVCSERSDHLSSILAEYGIKYISAPFSWMGFTSQEKPSDAAVENGIITTDRGRDLIKWSEVGPPIPDSVRGGYFGMHWINVLNTDVSKNDETTEKWIKYFDQYRNRFDILISRDNAMASSQSLYRKYAAVSLNEISAGSKTGKKMAIDFSAVDMLRASALLPSIYINIIRPYVPIPDNTAVVEVYEENEKFVTYKVTRQGCLTGSSVSTSCSASCSCATARTKSAAPVTNLLLTTGN